MINARREDCEASGRNYAGISWESILGGNKSHLHLRVICLANHASVAGFIVDFYCHKAALVIEVDGDIHDLQQEEDARREKVLSEIGLRIVRFGNDEVMKNLSAVVGKIREFIIHNPCSLGRNYVRISWESILGGSKSSRGSSLIFTVTRWGWLLKWMETSMIYSRKKMQDGRRF